MRWVVVLVAAVIGFAVIATLQLGKQHLAEELNAQTVRGSELEQMLAFRDTEIRELKTELEAVDQTSIDNAQSGGNKSSQLCTGSCRDQVPAATEPQPTELHTLVSGGNGSTIAGVATNSWWRGVREPLQNPESLSSCAFNPRMFKEMIEPTLDDEIYKCWHDKSTMPATGSLTPPIMYPDHPTQIGGPDDPGFEHIFLLPLQCSPECSVQLDRTKVCPNGTLESSGSEEVCSGCAHAGEVPLFRSTRSG